MTHSKADPQAITETGIPNVPEGFVMPRFCPSSEHLAQFAPVNEQLLTEHADAWREAARKLISELRD